MRSFISLAIVMGLAMSAGPARAGEDAQQRAKGVAQFLDEQTVLVGRVDMSRVNVDAAWDAAEQAGLLDLAGRQPTGKEAAEIKQQAKDWIAAFTAAGAKDIYMVYSLADLPSGPPFLVVPVKDGGDAEKVRQMVDGWLGRAQLAAGPPGQASEALRKRFGNAVFAGGEEVLDRLCATAPAARPELAEALSALDDTGAECAFIPTKDMRRVIEEIAPTLPDELGGGPSTALTRGVIWAAAQFSLEPQASLEVVIQSQDEQAARALLDAIRRACGALGQEEEVGKLVHDPKQVAVLLTPRVEGSRLILTLEKAHIKALMANLPLSDIRRAEERKTSVGHVKQILLAFMMHAEDHNGQWPANLQALVAGGMIDAAMLQNPSRPDLPVGYLYVPPPVAARELADASRTVVVYEIYERNVWPMGGVTVGFADGHVAVARTEAELKELIAFGAPAKQK